MVEIAVMLVAASHRVVVPDDERHSVGVSCTTDVLQIVFAEEVGAVRLMLHATIFSDINGDVIGDIFVM